jgi:AraC-like DNA-binding protein
MSQVICSYSKPETPMGLVYLKGTNLSEIARSWPRPILIVARGATILTVKIGRKTYSVDSTQILWVPKKTDYSIESENMIFDMLIMLPDEKFVREAIEENHLSLSEKNDYEKKTFHKKRTRWLDDILDRYHFERVLNAASPLGCTFFLEKQIINEVIRILFSEKFLKYGQAVDQGEGPLSQDTLRYIEANLFEEIQLVSLAKHSHQSVSTLIRRFRKEMGLPPHAYIKERRLEEALRFLKSGEYQVADVSTIVGYRDFSSFTKAFRAKFGKPPSSYLPKSKH